MRTFRLLSLLLLLAFSAQSQVANIIPAPVSYQAKSGFYLLSDKMAGPVVASSPAERVAASHLVKSLGLKGKNWDTKMAAKAGQKPITLLLNSQPAPNLGKEGYTLEVTSKGITLRANEPAGLFYGVQSLAQLMEGNQIAACSVVDYPRFGWRGLMLDVSRHFFTKEEVKSFIDQMARYKLNTFHWHLTDDNGWRVEIKSLPKLTQVGACRVPRIGRWGEVAAPGVDEPATDCGFYTQDDIREIVAYASMKHITIVPEIDVPGHSMAAIAAYPELSCTQDPSIRVNPGSNFAEWFGDGKFKMFVDNTLDPSSELVYEFLDKVFTEVAALFPGQYIHIGGDECYYGYWENDADCQALMKKEGMTALHDLQSYFNKRLEKIILAKGKKLIGWDEILEGGLAPSAAVMSWRGTKGGIEAAKMGHEVVMTPTSFCYLDYMQGDPTLEPPVYSWLTLQRSYNYEPVPTGVDPKFILGGQGNLWTEKVPNLRTAQYMTYPRAFALAEVFWTPSSRKNWEDFSRRVEKEFERCDALQYRYYPNIYDAVVWPRLKEGKLMVELKSEVPGQEIYYTIDGTMPDAYTSRYTAPVEIPDLPITLRVTTYRNGKQTGRTITVTREQLLEREARMKYYENMFE